MGTAGDGPYKYEKAKDDMPTIVLWGRTLISLLLIPVAVSAFRDEYGAVALIGDVDTAVHEFGHPFFQVISFGNETMTVLGGSLFQIVFPLFFAAYFLWPREGRKRDVHAAMVCLWWCGLNVLHVSIYMGDAVKQQLTLISGGIGADGEFHDWHWLLAHWNALSNTDVYAHRLRAFAKLCCSAGVIVGLLWTWWPKIAGTPATTPQTESS